MPYSYGLGPWLDVALTPLPLEREIEPPPVSTPLSKEWVSGGAEGTRQQKTRQANLAGFGQASREAYLRRNFELNFSTRPAESTKRFSPV